MFNSGCKDQLEADLAAAKSGDALGFEAIVSRFETQVYHLARWVLGDPGEAEDISQEVFLKFLQHMPGLSVKKNLRGWFCKVTLNLAKNRLRANKRLIELSEHHVPQLIETSDSQFEARNWLQSHLPSLTFKERTALVLVHLFGFSTKEAAAVMGCRRGTVKTLCFRARTKLTQSHRKELHH